MITKKINLKFDNWRLDFMLLLIEYYKIYSTTKIPIPDNVKKWTLQYEEEMDQYLSFLNECTENSETHIHTSTLYDAFKKWFSHNNPRTKIPSNREFTINLKKHKDVKRVRAGGPFIMVLKN